eukprot:CAMPEP_0197906582 /NCGR_PEP_ID=MMETSP1439-20131203/62996_1 /TAXON_ID=66791 /ORGANISM="Gonyaulax spinifera, Strain CCMP409" /LENGTH=277 /DNA_ID=CAMNT_0043527953 /DNA_START=43 /DNA_END=877 /DNA_ORIENTATION=+
MACQTLEFRGCLLGPVSPGCGGGDEHSAKADAKSWAALEAEQKRPCRTPLEAVQMLLHGPPGLPASWVPEALYALENLQRRFMRFCSNRDGSLSMQDFAALMKSYNSCRPEDCEAFFCAFQRGSRDSPAPPAAVDRLDDDADHRLADGRPDYEGVDPDPSEGRLSFRDFARGVCAADPECTLTLTERAKYIFDFLIAGSAASPTGASAFSVPSCGHGGLSSAGSSWQHTGVPGTSHACTACTWAILSCSGIASASCDAQAAGPRPVPHRESAWRYQA